MNWINKSMLALVLLPQKAYSNSGVNTVQLKSILTAKLLMDDRRPAAMFQSRRQKVKKQVSNTSIATLFVSAFMGCIFLFSFSLNASVVVQLTFYFAYFIFMMASTLIADFTSVLIDVRDNYIILPKPVNDRTVLLARLLHIFIHISKIVLPMLLPGIIYTAVNYGVTGSLLLLITGLLSVLFSIFLINAVYILILRITSPEKFKTIISYIQIVFAVVLYASFQLLPRMMGNLENMDFHFSNSHWLVLLPPYWFATAWSVLYQWQATTTEYLSAILGVALPFISLWVVVRFLAPSFNRKLAMISNTGNDITTPPTLVATKKKTGTGKEAFSTMAAKLLTKPGAERMGFQFSWRMMARSRDFKMKVYPAIGYFIVYGFIVFFNSKNLSLQDVRQQTTGGRTLIIIALYFCSLLLTTAVTQLIYSDKYKAAWLYFITPVATPGNIINGSVKAAIVKFFIPAAILIAIPGFALLGVSFLPNLILALANQLVICYLTVYIGYKELPFSRSQTTDVKTGNFLRNLMRLIIPISIAIFHYFIYTILPAVIVVAVLSCIALWMIMGSVNMASWAAIKTAYSEE